MQQFAKRFDDDSSFRLDDSEILDVFNRTCELAVEIQQQNWSHLQQLSMACRRLSTGAESWCDNGAVGTDLVWKTPRIR